MNLRRRALSLAAIAALSLALVPTPALAAAGHGACAQVVHRSCGSRHACRSQRRRPREGHRSGTSRPPGPSQGQGTLGLLRHRARLLPRHHRRLVGSLTDRQIRSPDCRAQRRVQRQRGRHGHGLLVHAGRHHAYGQAAWFATTGSAEAQMKQALKRGRRQRAERLLDKWRGPPRLGLPPQHHGIDEVLPRRHRHQLGERPGRIRHVRRPV